MFDIDFSNARSITIPDGVVEIGPATFAGCTKLASIVIPDGVKSIGQFAYQLGKEPCFMPFHQTCLKTL